MNITYENNIKLYGYSKSFKVFITYFREKYLLVVLAPITAKHCSWMSIFV